MRRWPTICLTRKVASLYRIHETPDPVKVYEFNEIAHSFGYTLGRVIGEKSLALFQD